jgi:hypothetical protein
MNKLTLGAIIAGLTYLVLLFVTPLVRFQPWFKWWDDHQPKDGNKQRCMPMALLAYQSSATFLYGIAELFMISENQKLDHSWQAEFLLRVMGRYGVDVANPGFLTPYGLCTSIAPQKGDAFHDDPHKQPSVQGSGTSWPDFQGWPQDQSDDMKQKYGMRNLWMGLLASWGVTTGAKTPNYNPKIWESNDTSPSNFLWQLYRIPGNSALVEAFVQNSKNDQSGNPWFPEALTTMLGINSESGAGGWVGLLRAGGDWGGYGLISMEAYIWAHEVSNLPDEKSPLKKCGAPGVASAALQGLNMAAMGAMTGAAAGGWGALIGGIAGLLGGGLLGAAQYKCL